MLVQASVGTILSDQMYHPVERYKLSVVGDSQSGKTCLLKALVKSDFEVC